MAFERTEEWACPCCSGVGAAPIIFEAHSIPVNSCVLLDTPEEAQAYPKGDLALAVCPCCGFAGNTLFDESLVDYSSDYEMSQGHSATFGRFARELGADWMERYKLSGSRVVEIGCGHGEFLSMMLELGAASAVGFDPICRAADSGPLKLIDKEFSAEYAELGGDFVFCRHTLEHLQDVRGLLTEIRKYAGKGTNIPVCFEVPDFGRILDEGAFWDIYYEHCAYFDPDSLSWLFSSLGYQILDVRLVYDNQYLIIETLLNANDETSVPVNGVDDEPNRPDMSRVADFVANTKRSIEEWRRRLAKWTADGNTVCLWGSGSKAVGFMSGLAIDQEIACVVDINPAKQGKYMPGFAARIVAPESLIDVRPDVIVVMNPVYMDEIGQNLQDLGLSARLIPAQ